MTDLIKWLIKWLPESLQKWAELVLILCVIAFTWWVTNTAAEVKTAEVRAEKVQAEHERDTLQIAYVQSSNAVERVIDESKQRQQKTAVAVLDASKVVSTIQPVIDAALARMAASGVTSERNECENSVAQDGDARK